MKTLWTLACVIIYAKYGLCAIDCNPEDDCVCFTGPSLEVQCPANHVENDSYTVIHIKEEDKIEIDCYNMETFSFDLLPNITINKINKLLMSHCPVPPEGFWTILDWFSIEKIEVLHFERCPHKNITLTKNDFKGLDQLEGLKLLMLNETTQFEDDVFSNTPNLRVLELERNDDLELASPNIFKNTPLLNKLYMAKNNLKDIPDGFFEELLQLQTLHLWGNNLTRIRSLTFSGLVNLKSLELSRNKIESIDENAFVNLRQISQINLSDNKLRHLPPNLFRSNKNLEKIYMIFNAGLELPDYLFANLPSLKMIHLRICDLKSLPEHVFENSTKLEKLDLGVNNLTHLSKNLFKGLVNLKELILRKNFISAIEHDTFKFLTGLEKLDVEGNSISKIDHRAFYDKLSLIKINFAHNRYPAEDGTLQKLNLVERAPNIEEINFSYNEITEVNQVISVHQAWRLKKLDLRYNKIAEISLVALQSLSHIEVKLDYNNITKIQVQDVDNNSETGKSVMFVSHNPFDCDCYNYDFLQYAKNDQNMFDIRINDLKCANPPELKNMSVDSLSPSLLKCPLEKMTTKYTGCPEECSCSWRPHDKSVIVDCSNKNLTQFPEIDLNEMLLLSFTQLEVHLEENYLTVGPDRNSGYYNVTHLNLSYNQIETIAWLPPNLKLLSLDHNQLSHLSSDVLETLNTSSLVNVTLEDNPWSCDCDAVNFIKFLRAKQVDARYIYCFNSSRLLIDLKSRDLCIQWEIYLGVILLLIFLLIAVLFALYYRNQQELKIWLFAHNLCLWWVTEEELDKDKIYDAFISYSHKDEDFVVQNLLPVLEDGPVPYKLCLHYRNWVPGEFISSQVTNSVVESRRTLVVLSPNFLESVWGKMEFRTAHTQAMTEGRARVIIVLYGDVDISSLDDELKSYLKTNTYVKWGDPYFWNKLKYALPHSKRKASKNNQKIANVLNYIDDKFNLVVPVTPSPGSTPPVLALDSSDLKKHPLSFRSNSEMCTPPMEAGNYV